MKRYRATIAGMELEVWEHDSCTAEFGVGLDWATLYSIRSQVEGQGHATALLLAAKAAYEAEGKRVGGSVALTDRMRRLYQRLGIHEYADEEPT